MASKGLLGRVAGALGRMLLQKERVGTAPGGLLYYRRTERNEHGEEVEKRWVKFPASAGHGYYNPAAIAPEWSQVLRHLLYHCRPTLRNLHGQICRPHHPYELMGNVLILIHAVMTVVVEPCPARAAQ
jgi:NADH:ubiquinone oxidoreductase subunit